VRVHLEDRDGFIIAGDALRGFMCAFIILVHAYLGLRAFLPQYGWGFEARAVELGSMAMFSFFILSGYLVGGPFARRFVEGRGLPAVRRYLEKRARRVLPAFWIIVTLALTWFGTVGATHGRVAAVYLFQQNLYPSEFSRLFVQAWTLDIEVAFYVALPIVFWAATRWLGGRGTEAARRAGVLAVLTCTFLVSFYLHFKKPATNAPSTSIFTFWWVIAPGIALAVLETPGRAWLAARPGLAQRLGAAALAGAIGLVVAVIAFDPVPQSAWIFTVELCGAAGFVLGAFLWQWGTGRAPAFFEFRPWHALGRWSYSMYLLHIAIAREVVQHIPDGAGQVASYAFVAGIMLAGSIAGGALLWWLVEEPVLTKSRPTRHPLLKARREEPSATLP
jgi:peptidoglycan/LPS O-acetylase OafA/YrhL